MSPGLSLTRRAALNRKPVTPFGPASVAGLQFWLKADALTPVADGTNVSAWADSSSNGNNTTVLGTAAKYYSSVVNGLPVVRWAAGDTRYVSASASSAAAAQTLFIVAKLADLSADHAFIGGGGNGAVCYYVSTTGALVVTTQGENFPVFGAAGGAGSAGTFGVFSASVTSGSSKTYKDGTPKDTATTTFTTTANGTYVGAHNAAKVFAGDIAEVIRYSTVLADADRIAIHGYLGTKYGITMGGS